MYYVLGLVYYGLHFAITNPAIQSPNNPENLSSPGNEGSP